MHNGLQWEAIDIVAACMQNYIKLNLRPEKRFYRLRFTNGYGIFDSVTHSILRTTDAIFTEEVEKHYRYAGNNLESIEQLSRPHLAAYTRKPGALAEKIKIAHDFDAPLPHGLQKNFK